MRTSRVSQETAKVMQAITRRSTRAFASQVQSFSSTDASLDRAVKCEPDSPSTVPSTQDIEDIASATTTPRKRKRGLETPSTAVTTISASTSTRTSPRKPGVDIADGSPGRYRKARKQPAKRIKQEDGSVMVEPPANWEEIYTTTQEIRRENLAPVDTMGCERIADPKVSEKDQRFQTLVSLMISSQTKDTTNALTMRRLQTELPAPGLNLENILKVTPHDLNEMIWAVGFHNNKTRYIKAAAEILRDEHNGDIPDTVEGLMSLPGVGPKMAYLCMSAAWGKHEGIGVDVHVHRITNLWGWHKTNQPEETRAALEAWLPKEKWHEINHLLVGFGQTICKPVGRKCTDCKLAQRSLCPSAVVDGKAMMARKIEIETQYGDGLREKVVVKDEVEVKQEIMA